MSNKTQHTNYNSLLKDIEKFYENNGVEAYTMTLDRSFEFAPLNVRQLKSFMALQVQYDQDNLGLDQGTQIAKEINNVLQQNCIDGGDDILTTLTILDRDAILLQLRANVDPVAKISTGDNDDTQEVDLLPVTDRIRSAQISKDILSTVKTLKFNTGEIEMSLQIPTLDRDMVITDFFVRQIKSLVKSKSDLDKHGNEIFTQVYFMELFKYIKQLQLGDNCLDFYNKKLIPKNIEVLENLPTQIIGEITDYVKDVKSYRDSILFYTNNEGKDVPLDIDANIFIGL